MLHPVGPLPARVYWRRRLLVLTLLVAVLGGAAVGGIALVSGRATSGATTATDTVGGQMPSPALEQVVPSLTAVRTPAPVPPAAAAAEAAAEPVTAAPPAPVAGGPCTDDMLAIEVRTPGSAAVGSKPTFDLVVTNASAVPCVRALDKNLQELIMLDAAGERVWGSNDCFPEASSDVRTLAPGEAVVFPVVWGGLTSLPGCAAPRSTPPPGSYAVRGRLDTKSSPDASLALT
ncbi:MucR family transcriptional regulator [Candidatus Blastococcus massiliensis]|uniref:MucR family transcriptional regulator n=1 Tax=Candidatus Blastococcus massiliensis TaxID=1470358 RepID=UPI0004B4B959|nr:MucR family transcriptional regulator [Candidatus Blastococcus massiliensis]